MFQSANDRKRALAVFGQGGVDKIEARMNLERIMDGARKALGNSTTVRQMIEAGLAGGAIGGYYGGKEGAASGAVSGAASVLGAHKTAFGQQMLSGAQRVIGYVDRNTAAKVAELLVSDDPRKLREGISLATQNRRIFEGLKQIANRFATAGGLERSSVLNDRVFTGTVPSAAQGDQGKRDGLRGDQPNQRVGYQAGGPAERAAGGAVHNHNPSEAQKRVGNYAKTHKRFHGLDITIENLKGSRRRGTSKDGRPWSVIMPASYGYIKRTTGADNDHLDCYLLPNEKSDQVFVIDQKDDTTGRFDEHKVIFGASSEREARSTYLAGFSDGKDRIKHIRRMTIGQFKEWLHRGDTSRPIKAQTAGLNIAYRLKRTASEHAAR